MSEFINIIKKRKDVSLFLVLAVSSVLMLSFSTGGSLLRPKEIGFTVISGVQSAFSAVGGFFSGTVNSINELSDLREEYKGLQQKLAEYQEMERNILELKSENSMLRQQLGFSRTSPFHTVPAEVIGKDPGNSFSSIVINKGTVDGIKRDMPVIALQDGYHGLVGKVVEAGAFSSKILPIYNISSYVSARLQRTRYEGLISGTGADGSSLRMDYVKKMARDDLSIGDFVITSGMNSIYPKGIYIGKIKGIDWKDWDMSLQLEIEPIIDFSRLEYVYVLNEEKPAGNTSSEDEN